MMMSEIIQSIKLDHLHTIDRKIIPLEQYLNYRIDIISEISVNSQQ